MYKNFKLTEEEKQQILESHISHGYKKPLKEDNDFKYDEFFKKQRQDAMDHMRNSSPKSLYMDKVTSKLNSLVYHIEDEIENLMSDAFQESSDKMDMSVSDELANMIISKLNEVINNIKSEHLEKEPSDDDIYNQPGSEGGISYGGGSNFQGR